MKTKLLIIAIFLSIASIAQNNRSAGNILTNFTGATPVQQFSGGEIFRFQPGIITQLDTGTGFGFTADRWFSLGRLNTGSQTVYGLRFQLPNKSVTFGYNNITNANPRIEWVGTGANLGNLEFRVANSFSSTVSTFVASMNSDGSSIFGSSAVAFNSNAKVRVLNDVVSAFGSVGLNVDNSGSPNCNGIVSIARNGTQSNYGVLGITLGTAPFEAGIYGETNASNNNQWAGYFDGNVFATNGTFQTSDRKLKENIKSEESILSKLSQLNPVNYNYKKIKELNLATGLQHGFVAQELEAVFPELVRDVSKPIFDKERNFISNYEFKSVNYSGMISILTAAIQELNAETVALREELNNLKTKEVVNKINNSNVNFENLKLEQNVPNPFQNETQIKYEIPNFNSNSSIIVFDLNGKLIKEYSLSNKSGIVIVKSSDIGKGLFLYSLVIDGNELLTKKMLVK